MAEYKVPQNVEADDKLIGPFSFRQFVYLIIMSLSIGLSWALSQLFFPLFLIPLPVIVFFAALALPLRKDQPMEIYLAAIVSFILKPHTRLWDPDGIDSLIEITAPKTVNAPLTKGITQDDAQQRFRYLAQMVDSQGWAIRNPTAQSAGSAMTSESYFEAQQAEDILGDTYAAKRLDQQLNQSDAKHREEITSMMQERMAAAASENTQPAVIDNQPPATTASDMPVAKPVIDEPVATTLQPEPTVPTPQPEPAINTSDNQPSAGIIELANSDLSIQTIAHQANRLQAKQDNEKELFISLR